MKIYGCYFSATYVYFVATVLEAQEWTSTHGIEFNECWFQGQYEELEVSNSTYYALLNQQPCCGYEEALTYQA